MIQAPKARTSLRAVPRSLVLAIAVLTGGDPISAAPTPTSANVVVDLAHAQIGQPEGQSGLNYTVPPSQRIRVDARTFDFRKGLYPKVRPNAIQLVIGKDRKYSAVWDPSGMTELTTANLTPINDSPPFTGLKAGDRAILAIGEQRVEQGKNEIILKALWVALIDVR